MKRRIAKLCIALGLLMILFAAGLFGYNYWENKKAEESANAILQTMLEEHTFWVDGIEYIGYLGIPSQGLTLPVMADIENLDLNLAPCRDYGTVKEDNLVIAGHNFVAHFGKLFNLHVGDAVNFTDADGKVTDYTVAAIETLGEDESERMTESGYDLTLYTCTLDGHHRLAVRCEKV